MYLLVYTCMKYRQVNILSCHFSQEVHFFAGSKNLYFVLVTGVAGTSSTELIISWCWFFLVLGGNHWCKSFVCTVVKTIWYVPHPYAQTCSNILAIEYGVMKPWLLKGPWDRLREQWLVWLLEKLHLSTLPCIIQSCSVLQNNHRRMYCSGLDIHTQ